MIYLLSYKLSKMSGEDEQRLLYFSSKEKGELIKKYHEVKGSWYAYDIRVFKFTQFEEIDMEKVLGGI